MEKIKFDGNEYAGTHTSIIFKDTLLMKMMDFDTSRTFRKIFNHPIEIIQNDSRVILRYECSATTWKLLIDIALITMIENRTNIKDIDSGILQKELEKLFKGIQGNIHFIKKLEEQVSDDNKIISFKCETLAIEKIGDDVISFSIECSWFDGTKIYNDFYKRGYAPPFIDPFIDDSSLYPVKMRQFDLFSTNKFKEIIRGKKEDDENEKKM